MQPAEIIEAREFANRLRDSLPSSVDAAALGVRSKAPFQLLCTREALIWRTEELARNACDALERDDFAATAILTRAVTESGALAWKMMELLDARQTHSPQALNELLMRLLAGSKKWDDAPKPFHVLDCIDRMDKKVPGVRANYDSLSEFAHPNWSGVVGLYTKTDTKKFITYFGRGLRGADSTRRMIANAMLGSLGLFEYAYNRISTTMPAFLAELESIWSEEKGIPTE
jgi:hypothetical protein